MVRLGASLGRCSRQDQWGGDLGENPELGGEIISQHWPGKASASELANVARERAILTRPRISGPEPDPDKRMRMRMRILLQ